MYTKLFIERCLVSTPMSLLAKHTQDSNNMIPLPLRKQYLPNVSTSYYVGELIHHVCGENVCINYAHLNH